MKYEIKLSVSHTEIESFHVEAGNQEEAIQKAIEMVEYFENTVNFVDDVVEEGSDVV